MLSSMLKQHQEQIKGCNETQEQLKKETVTAANELTQNLVIFFFFPQFKFSFLTAFSV